MKNSFTYLLGVVMLLSASFPLFSQKQANIWYFGDKAGVDFNSGSPVALTNGQTYSPDSSSTVIEGVATMSDNNGSLLFYTNGNKIWNKNHQVMLNGDSLYGNFSSTQSSIIIPRPGSSRFFYVFTTSDFVFQDLLYGFRYSVVDMCLDGGNGDVVPGQKNILLLDTIAEKLTAVRHSNGTDYWILVHKYYSEDFYAFLLTSTGITSTVISTIGSRHPLSSLPQISVYAIGSLKASPDGSKLAIGSANGHCIAEYFDFNKSTGVVSNSVNVQPGLTNNYYGISFSPDNTKLYFAGILNNYNIFQYDLTRGGGHPDSVRASRTPIAMPNMPYRGLQLATDGKIYVSNSTPDYLSVINNPNAAGLACNYSDSAVYLSGRTAGWGLPNFVDNFDYSNTTFNCAAVSANEWGSDENGFLLFPNPAGNAFTIDFPSAVEDACLILYNTEGQELLRQNGISGKRATISSKGLKRGLYLVRIFQQDKVPVSQPLLIE